jgi:hypothetical protein
LERITGQLDTLKYSDLIKFFEVYPKVTHIYQHTMNSELHGAFLRKLEGPMQDARFPMKDLCRILDILVTVAPYASRDSDKVVMGILTMLKKNIYGIPKEHFTSTMANLLEF